MENGSSERSRATLRSRSDVQNVLLRFASIDPIELCKEAKLELCRATRDLRSCGRYVQHVLNSCGHACLCVECSKRCDVCPLCRTIVPKNTSVSQLRLYDECVKVGLVSKERDDQFQEDEGNHLTVDVQRLYSFFDVAVEQNLVTLICHYITDVCMDESAVSSDPVMSILLDEVVVMEWCRRSFRSTLSDLQSIYKVGVKEMIKMHELVMKPMLLLAGVANVLEVLESSFDGIQSPQLDDLHYLSENVLKAKQHLDVMQWCLKHHFLEHMPSRYPTILSWRSVVNERKSAAVERSWPEFLTNVTEETPQPGSSLFIEDALSNIGIEQGFRNTSGELDAACLQKDSDLSLPFRSRIEGMTGVYPFENLRAAVDMLFLRGSSDLVVAKQATLIYYLFDRHWNIADGEWRKVVDDYATTFGIGRHAVLESLVFYLLDDHTAMALKEACRLLPEISATEMHLKIPQVLLEREMPDAALMVLRCSGHDGLSSYSLHNATNSVPLREAVTAIRVKIECGLLTQAFTHQKAYCSMLKEEQLQNKRILESDYHSWKDQMEILVTEICLLCIRRNLVDRMIELPWNIDEEKCLHKCLLDNAFQDMASTSGSLLVVYYLQRCRYVEAYQVDLNLTKFYDNVFSKSTDQEMVSKIKSINQWRTGLMEKCIDLLPEVQRQQLKSGSMADVSFPNNDVISSPQADTFGTLQRISNHLSVSSSPISLILPMDVSPPKKPAFPVTDAEFPETSIATPLDSIGRRGSSPLGGQSFPSVRTPSFFSCMGSPTPGKTSEPRSRYKLDQGLMDRKLSALNGIVEGYNLSYDVTPLKETHRGSSKFKFSASESPSLPAGRALHSVDQNGRSELLNSRPSLLNGTSVENCNHGMESELREDDDWMSIPSEHLLKKDKSRTPGSLVSGKRFSPLEPIDFCDRADDGAMLLSSDCGQRWRSDETSEDEEEPSLAKNRIGPPSTTPARVGRGRRHFRGTAI